MLLAGFTDGARAQPAQWPQRPLRMIVSVAPGGPVDVLARLLAPRLAERLGQPVVVENRAGAGGDIGIESAARAAPDGYTIMLAQTSLVVNPALRQTSYDPVRDFAAVIPLVQSELWLVASPGFPARTAAEALDVARARADGVTCGSGGGLLQFACELFKSQGRLKLVTLPYKGVAPALHDVAMGEVDLAFATVGAASGLVQAGRLKVLGSSDSRTERERATGVAPIAAALPGFDLRSWQGIVAPAGTPPEIVGRQHRELVAVLAEPEVRRKLGEAGYDVVGGSPEDFGRTIARDAERFAGVARSAAIRE